MNTLNINDTQVIQLTYGDLKRIISEMQAPTKRWVKCSVLTEKFGLTADEIKGLRNRSPRLFKRNDTNTRWLVDITKYAESLAA